MYKLKNDEALGRVLVLLRLHTKSKLPIYLTKTFRVILRPVCVATFTT